MLREGGYARIFFPEGNRDGVATLDRTKVQVRGSLYEASTFTCCHCNAVVHVPPKADVNFVGMCRNCMKPICQRCSGLACEPFERKLQAAEEREHRMREYGLES